MDDTSMNCDHDHSNSKDDANNSQLERLHQIQTEEDTRPVGEFKSEIKSMAEEIDKSPQHSHNSEPNTPMQNATCCALPSIYIAKPNTSSENTSLELNDNYTKLNYQQNEKAVSGTEMTFSDDTNHTSFIMNSVPICSRVDEERRLEELKGVHNKSLDEEDIQDKMADDASRDQHVEIVSEQFAPVESMEYVTADSSSHIQEFFDSKFSFSPSCSLKCVDTASAVFKQHGQENFLKGCKWSPDGTQIVTNSNDNILRTFTPLNQGATDNKEMNPNCIVRESGLIYDYSWLPVKTDSKPDSCRIACSCPGSPIHLWNSNQGTLVSSYRAFDQNDEVTHAYSLSFSHDGTKIYGGYKNSIRIFDTEYSHRKSSLINTFDSKSREGHKGIISCFCHGPPESRTFVSGSYSRHVGIYYSLTNKLICLIQGQQGGVTHVMLSPDGNMLYTGGRKDPEIVCWDMRNVGHVLCTYLRDVQTNQRIYFDLSQSGRYLISGNHDGSVQVWDTTEPGHEVEGEIIMKPCYTFQAHADCTNGVSFNPETAKLATASGQRHFHDFELDSDSDDSGTSGSTAVRDFSLKVWSIPCIS